MTASLLFFIERRSGMDGKNEMLVATITSVLTWQGAQTSLMIDKERYLAGMISLDEYKGLLERYGKIAAVMTRNDNVTIDKLKEVLC
jgi:hypothetical protein